MRIGLAGRVGASHGIRVVGIVGECTASGTSRSPMIVPDLQKSSAAKANGCCSSCVGCDHVVKPGRLKNGMSTMLYDVTTTTLCC